MIEVVEPKEGEVEPVEEGKTREGLKLKLMYFRLALLFVLTIANAGMAVAEFDSWWSVGYLAIGAVFGMFFFSDLFGLALELWEAWAMEFFEDEEEQTPVYDNVVHWESTRERWGRPDE